MLPTVEKFHFRPLLRDSNLTVNSCHVIISIINMSHLNKTTIIFAAGKSALSLSGNSHLILRVDVAVKLENGLTQQHFIQSI